MTLGKILSTTCIVSFVSFAAFAAVAQSPPNILLVIADDMGVDASPCHDDASQLAKMPNLKALCDDGIVFESAYSAPVCSPTRATILTGKYGFRTNVTGVVSAQSSNALSSSETTLFDHLNDASIYQSAVIGKWHLNAQRNDLGHPKSLGVDYYVGPYSGGVSDYYSWRAVNQGRRERVAEYATTYLSDKAIDWIEIQTTPWFLWLAYNAPHTPFHAPPSALHSFGNLPEDTQSMRRNPDRYYFAALEALDTEMGRVLDAIDPDERDNTVVIFVGDNGTPGQLFRGSSLQGRKKGSLFEGGTNVPLVISGPLIDQNRRLDLVTTTDLFETILGLAGVDAGTTDSFDLSPILSEGKPSGRQYAFTEVSGRPNGGAKSGWAIRDHRYKLIQLDGLPAELYDLQTDPSEQFDLLVSPAPVSRAIAKNLVQARPQ